MRAVFTMALITILVGATRKPSEVQGQSYLELETIQMELDAGAMPMVAKGSALPNASSVLQSLAEDGLMMPVGSSLLNSSGGLRRGGTFRLPNPNPRSAMWGDVEAPNESRKSSTPLNPFTPTGGDDARPMSFKTIVRSRGKDKDYQDYTYLRLLGLGGFGGTWSAVEGRPDSIEAFAKENARVVKMYNGGLQAWYRQVNRTGSLSNQPTLDAEIVDCPQLWAIKASTKKKSQLTKEVELAMWSEVYILGKFLGNPYVSQLKEAFSDKAGYSYIVMEYFPGGAMFDTVLEEEKYTFQHVKLWFHELLRGLKSIHSAGVAHRDIKLENLMFTDNTEDRKPRFIDFGFALVVESDETLYAEPLGSIDYAAPEIFKKSYLPKATDIWALGVVLFMLVSGANQQEPLLPFHPKNNLEGRAWTSGLAGRLRSRKPPDEVIKILAIMLSDNPTVRLQNFDKLLGMWK